MKRTIWTFIAALASASIVTVHGVVAQGPAPNSVRPLTGTKAAPKDPSASPASRPRPATVNAQSFPEEQVLKGEQRFAGQCGFCHGRDAAGGEQGPDLTRSALVAEDN